LRVVPTAGLTHGSLDQTGVFFFEPLPDVGARNEHLHVALPHAPRSGVPEPDVELLLRDLITDASQSRPPEIRRRLIFQLHVLPPPTRRPRVPSTHEPSRTSPPTSPRFSNPEREKRSRPFEAGSLSGGLHKIFAKF